VVIEKSFDLLSYPLLKGSDRLFLHEKQKFRYMTGRYLDVVKPKSPAQPEFFH
jgi:hypothetical protein